MIYDLGFTRYDFDFLNHGGTEFMEEHGGVYDLRFRIYEVRYGDFEF